MKRVSLARTKFNSLLLSATLTMLVTYLMLLADTLIVGNVVGENGIAAINIVTPLYSAANFVAGPIDNAKEVTRWIFDNKKGKVSNIITVNQNFFFIATIKDIHAEGFVPFPKAFLKKSG